MLTIPKYYFWIIQNEKNSRNPHPIHLHGHDFFILGQEADAVFTDMSQLQFNNTLRRDVAMLPPNGFLAIAIYTNNPGVWLMHCHVSYTTLPKLHLVYCDDMKMNTNG
jgi:FtsP/CotA-like multicopper oxidase with cupredoxin domain